MRWMFVWVALAACGDVKDSKGVDAPPAHDDGAIDSPMVCTVHDQVTSCGATCATCTVTSDRENAACLANACGFTCKSGLPSCSDHSCGKLAFDFSSGTTEGAIITQPAGLTAVIRPHNSNMALAIDTPTNIAGQEIRVTLPVCLTGGIDESARTLSAEIYYEGGTTDGAQYYVQVAVPAPATGHYIGSMSATHNTTTFFSGAMSGSTGSTNIDTVTFQLGSYGAAFTGTIWIDNISIH